MNDKWCTLCGWKIPLSIGFSEIDVHRVPTVVLRCPGTHPGGEIVDFHCELIDNAWVASQRVARVGPPEDTSIVVGEEPLKR